jgi:hypothetical protein
MGKEIPIIVASIAYGIGPDRRVLRSKFCEQKVGIKKDQGVNLGLLWALLDSNQ